MIELPQSNSAMIPIGYFTTASATQVTSIGLVASDDAELLKYQAGAVTDISSRTIVHIQGGQFNISLIPTDLDTLGPGRMIFRDENIHLPFHETFTVVKSNYWYSKYGADRLEVDVTTNNDKSGYSLSADQSDVTIGVVNSVGVVTSVQNLTNQVTVATNNDKTGYSISGSKTTLDALNDVSSSDLAAQITENDLDHIVKTGVSIPSNPSSGSYLDQMMNKDGSQTFDRGTDALEAIRDRGDAAWPTVTVPTNFASLNIGTNGKVDANVTQVGSDTQSATDLKDFADAGYNPSSNMVLFVGEVNTINDKTGYSLAADQSGVTVGVVNSVGVVTSVALVSDFGSAAKTAVNSEMVDVMTVDTMAELSQGAPPTNPTREEAAMLTYMTINNKETSTALEKAIYNAAGTKIAKGTLSDVGATFTKAKLVSGA